MPRYGAPGGYAAGSRYSAYGRRRGQDATILSVALMLAQQAAALERKPPVTLLLAAGAYAALRHDTHRHLGQAVAQAGHPPRWLDMSLCEATRLPPRHALPTVSPPGTHLTAQHPPRCPTPMSMSQHPRPCPSHHPPLQPRSSSSCGLTALSGSPLCARAASSPASCWAAGGRPSGAASSGRPGCTPTSCTCSTTCRRCSGR